MASSPSHSSPRDTSPVLVPLADKVKNLEKGKSDQDEAGGRVATTPLTKTMWRRSPGKKDEFWEALQSHYNYLMDGELIETCKEANGELSSEDASSSSYTWSFSEYTDEYKSLLDWIDKMQKEVEATGKGSPVDVAVRQARLEEVKKQGLRLKFLLEQAQRLVGRYPNLKDEIMLQLAHLNSCWNALEEAVANSKKDQDLLFDVDHEIRCLRKWLHEMEGKLGPLTIYPGWTPEDLEVKYLEHQELQKDIESRGKSVLSVLKLCERLQLERRQSSGGDVDRAHRVAINLERRWHAVWLRSLEWQCLLEELINKYKAGLLSWNNLDSSFGDEPLKKYPRLSGHWTGGGKTLFAAAANADAYDDDDEDLDTDDDDADAINRGDNAAPEDVMEVDPVPDNSSSNNNNVHPEYYYDNVMKTRDIGTDCSTLSTNDKGVMVGTTGIDELKADCDGNYGHFEIIQDVGYSSESSTHLSNDERGGDLIQVYTFDEKDPPPAHIPNDANAAVPNNSVQNKASNDKAGCLEVDDLLEPSGSGSDVEDGLVSRAGPNNATFHFHHVDTDPECKPEDALSGWERVADCSTPCSKRWCSPDGSVSPLGNVRSYGRGRRRQWSDSSTLSRVGSARALLEFLSDAESSQLDCSMSEDDAIGCSSHLTDSEKLQKLGLDLSPMRDLRQGRSNNKRESIHELVEEAERLVRREDCLSPEFAADHDHHHRQQQEQPPKSPVRFNGPSTAKLALLKEWLRSSYQVTNISATVLPPETVLDSSCDASCEYTSNDSEDEHSTSSEEQNNSVILCHQVATTTSDPETPTAEQPPSMLSSKPGNLPVKVVMRNKKRTNSDRPWSVTELYQRSNRLDLSPFSISESALNKLSSPTVPEAKGFNTGSQSVGTQKDLTSPSSDSMSSATVRKSKSAKSSRKRVLRRSDSGSEGLSRNSGSFPASGGSDRSSPSRRRQSKSHSSGSDSGRKPRSGGSGGGKSTSVSSGTEQYLSEVGLGGSRKVVEPSDSESEPTPTRDQEELRRLRHTEELSSVSEQAWDDYQDSPYLSEPYSEKLIDEDKIRRLMEFGDDYSTFIGNQSDSTSLSSYSATRRSPSKGRSPPSRLQTSGLRLAEPSGLDSDSDMEDFLHVIGESSSQLQFSENMLQRNMAKDYSSPQNSLDFVELLATCQTNIKCLEVIEEHLQSNNGWAAVDETDVKSMTETIHRWEMLHVQTQEQQQTTQRIRDVQQEIGQMRDSMSNISNSLASCSKGIENREILERVLREVQAYLSRLQEKKAALLTINVQVHSLLNNSGLDMSHLKEEVTALYHQWDDTYERSNHQLQAFSALKSTWLQYETELHELNASLQEERQREGSMSSSVTCLTARNDQAPKEERNGFSSAADTTTTTTSKTEAQLAHVQALARQLEPAIADTEAWASISRNLNSTAAEFRLLQQEKARSSREHLHRPPPSSVLAAESKKRVRFTTTAGEDESALVASRREKSSKAPARPLLWRVVRAALPIQLAIVVLFCLACLLEPHCCDSLNNFSFSFSPQLRYVRGPPPI